MNCFVDLTEMMTFSRGFALVFAEDVPAIAQIDPPSNRSSTLSPDEFVSDLACFF